MNKNRLILAVLLSVCIFVCLGSVYAIDYSNSTDNVITKDNSDLDSKLNIIEDDDPLEQVVNSESSDFEKLGAAGDSSDESEDLSRPTKEYNAIAQASSDRDRTFKIGKYKVTISKSDYAKFLYIPNAEKYFLSIEHDYYEGGDSFGSYRVSRSYTDSDDLKFGLYYEIRKPTNYFVKQKIGYGFKGYKLTKLKSFKSHAKALKYKKIAKKKYTVKIKRDKKSKKYVVYKQTEKYKKVVTKKARVYMVLNYGESQTGYAKKYMAYVETNYENPGYDIISGHITSSYKISNTIKTLNSAKPKK